MTNSTVQPDIYQNYRFSKPIRIQLNALASDNWHGIAFILKDYAVIAAVIWLTLVSDWWLYPLALLMIGAHQRALATLFHDAAHGVLAREQRLNFVLGTVFTAWPIFQTFEAYRISHVKSHHRYLGDAGHDPDHAFFDSQRVFEPAAPWRYALRIIILPVLGVRIPDFLVYQIRNRATCVFGCSAEGGWTPGLLLRRRIDVAGFLVFWLIVVTIVTWTGIWFEFILFWIVPYAVTFSILSWFIELSEHCSNSSDGEPDLFMSRNRRGPLIERLLTGINNDDHHLDHHLDPRTPFWLLPRAHQIRLDDPVYAEHCRHTGGLFFPARDGAPSILSILMRQNARRWQEQLDRTETAGGGQTSYGA